MAWTSDANAVTTTSKTSNTTIPDMSFAFTAGRLVVYVATFDNTGTATPTITSLTKHASETALWTRVAYHDSLSATSGAATRGEIWAMVPTFTGTATVTGTLSAAVTAKAAAIGSLNSGGMLTSLVTRSTAEVVGQGTTTAGGTPYSSGLSGATSFVAGDLGFNLETEEMNVVVAATWHLNTFSSVFTTGGGSAANVSLYASWVEHPNTTSYDTAGKTTTATDGGFTGIVFTMATPSTPTTAPTVVTATGAVTVTMPAISTSSNATSFKLYRDGVLVTTGLTGAQAYSDTGASAAATQTYTVKGSNYVADSASASSASSAVVADPNAPVFSLAAGNAQITVNVTKKSYDAVYKVYRATSGGSRTLVHTSATITGAVGTYSWSDNPLTNGTTYDYHATTSVATPTSRTSPDSSVQSKAPAIWTSRAVRPLSPGGDWYNVGVGACNGKLYALGGSQGSGARYSDADVYDVSTDTWTAITNLPFAVVYTHAVGVGTDLYMIGGYNASDVWVTTMYKYDTTLGTSGSWTNVSGGAIPASGYDRYFSIGVKIYLVDRWNNKTWVFDTTSPGSGWVDTASAWPDSTPDDVFITRGTLLQDGTMLLMGWTNNQPSDGTFPLIWNPTSNTWSRSTVFLPGSKTLAQMDRAAFGGYLYGGAFGGTAGVNTQTMQRYNPTANTWTDVDTYTDPPAASQLEWHEVGSTLLAWDDGVSRLWSWGPPALSPPISANIAITASLTATASVNKLAASSTAITAGLTATASIPITGTTSTATTATLTAACTLTVAAQASTATTAGLTANSARNTTGQLSTATTATLTADGVTAQLGQASTATTATLTADGVTARLAAVSSAVTASLTAVASIAASMADVSSPFAAILTTTATRVANAATSSTTTTSLTSDATRVANAGTTSITTVTLTSEALVTRNAAVSTATTVTLTSIATVAGLAQTSAVTTTTLTANSVRNTLAAETTATTATVSTDTIRATTGATTTATTTTLTTTSARTTSVDTSTATAVTLSSTALVTRWAQTTTDTTAQLTAMVQNAGAATGGYLFAGSATSTFGTPTGLTATAISGTQINLDWDEVPNSSGYDIERGGVIIVTNHVATNYSDTGLTPAVQYNYRVRAVQTV